MFRSKAWKWLLLGSAATIIVLYMMELTTSGIERVYGPLNQVESATGKRSSMLMLEQEKVQDAAVGLIPILHTEQDHADVETEKNNKRTVGSDSSLDQEIADLEAEVAELKRLALLKEKEQLQQQLLLNEDADKPAVNRMADSTSEVLQSASSSSIQFIAKLFSHVIN